MIQLIPAIDLIDGKCVRLTKGDYATQKIYNESPVAVAKEFESLGFKHLHLVDLDGAKSQHVVNIDVLQAITRETDLMVDFGGGIKTDTDIEAVFTAGATSVTIGSIAVKQPELFKQWLTKYGADQIILGADVRDGWIRINGWKEESSIDLNSFIQTYWEEGVRKVLCTDISKDGMLSGPAIALYKQIMKAFPSCQLIASGGVSCIEDLKELNAAGIPSVVFGKAIYEGRISLPELATWAKLEPRK
ncbi:MAG: 1-(5-phosphoribosyl)-5-[(5-phosphoribosylamino)methylideneamino]imidazole-4-carboxamide isomerase [Bacteroidaceae bacterium]